MVRLPLLRAVPFLCASLVADSDAATAQSGAILFQDDFEGGLSAWSFPLGAGHALVPAPGEVGTALALEVVDQPVYALIRGSERWPAVRVEGRVLFPDDDDNYLGFIYSWKNDDRRIDFGSLYIKGNGSYVQANTHSDTNVGRTLLPEYRTDLIGARAVEIGRWMDFVLEVADGEAHLYVGPGDVPVMTLPDAGTSAGPVGFKPRNPGRRVLLDDIVVREISTLSHRGAPVPDTPYRRGAYLTAWEMLGPLPQHDDAVERGARAGRLWHTVAADHRGAVRTGRLVSFRGPDRVAYLRSEITRSTAGDVLLGLSTADDLAVWVNGVFWGFAGRRTAAWWDAAWNADREPILTRVALRPGTNELLVRVTGGVYATGGFYAWVAEAAPPP